MTLLDLLLRPPLVDSARAYFRDVQTRDIKYQPLIRPEDRPPVELNREILEKYRPAMRPFYFDPRRNRTYLEQLGITVSVSARQQWRVCGSPEAAGRPMRRGVELHSLGRDEWRALGNDPERFASTRELDIGPDAELLRQVGTGTAEFLERVGVEPRWGSFLATDPASREVVGACSYKGAPDDEGVVEIAYYTFPPNEGAGYATAMAAALVARAAEPPAARVVRAHTLPERNASGRILERLGFAHLGQVVDPEDGPVWRWERTQDGRSPEMR